MLHHSNSTVVKDGLGFDEHLFTRGKYIAIATEEIFCDMRVRNDDEKLIPNPHRVKWTKFLCPIIKR